MRGEDSLAERKCEGQSQRKLIEAFFVSKVLRDEICRVFVES